MEIFMPKNEDTNKLQCSFCGKTQDQVRRLVAGPGVYICDECVELCLEIIEPEYDDNLLGGAENSALPKPKEIYEILNDFIIGQEDAKKALSVAVYNHYKRLSLQGSRFEKDADEVQIEKPVLFVKSLRVQTECS